MIGSPDHWHAKMAIDACRAGKDVYVEKPLTLTIDEGKLIRKVQKETGRIVQVGTQQRSTFPLFVKAIAIVQAGRLGKIKRVQAAIGSAPSSPTSAGFIPRPRFSTISIRPIASASVLLTNAPNP